MSSTACHQSYRIAIVVTMVAVCLPSPATAHEGPPFPILIDKPAGDYLVSIWADPDIGDAKFFIILESSKGGPPDHVADVSMWIEPISGRLERQEFPAEQQKLRSQVQYVSLPYFDQQDMWNIGFLIRDKTDELHEITAQVESTPPGYGRWDFVIYLFPFVLIACLWILAMLRRNARAQELSQVGNAPAEP